MRKRQSQAGFRGFSILELLVAMAIFATLLMIVLPAYRNWTAKSEAAAVAELVHNINLGVAEAATATGDYPEGDEFGFSPWGHPPSSLKQLLKDADFQGPGEIELAYWYVEPPRPHGPPQLRRPPHPFNGQGLHLGWADNSGPSVPVTSGGSEGGTDSPITEATPGVPPPTDKPGDPPPTDRPPGEGPPARPDDKPKVRPPGGDPGAGSGGDTTQQGSGGPEQHPVIFGGPSGSSSDCDPAIFDDCGPNPPGAVPTAPESPPRIGYVAVRASTEQEQAVLKRLMSLFPPEQVRPLDPGPRVILILLQE